MNYRMIARVLALVLLIMAALLTLPLICALVYRESIAPFAVTMAITAAAGGALYLVKPKTADIYAKEGLVSVGLAWVIMSLFGAIPFVISGDIPRYVDALFETVSGFTTTGSSVLNNVEALSKSGLFWRSFTHWIGGMGVLVFIMAVLPMNGEHSMHIMRAEVPGPVVGKLVPRARKTAMILYLIYTGFTVAETIILALGDMSFYEALLHAFGSAGTGGFSTRGASVGSFNSLYDEIVIGFFLILFGTNFNLFYLVLIGRWREAVKSEELHWYWGILITAMLAIAIGIAPMYGSFKTALRHAFFNVCSLITTAGFGTEDFTKWPGYVQSIIFVLMLIGGCAGSTGGGMKLSRVMLLVKTAASDVKRVISPRSVTRVQMDGRRVTGETTMAVYTFISLYFLLALACTLIVSFDGYDFATNFTAAITCMSNVGPGLSLIGPAGNFSIFSSLSKVTMAITMLFGRLEIYAMMILFVPSTWKRK